MDSVSGDYPARALTEPVDSARVVLDRQRDRAERMLNRARLIVLVLLGIAALVYAPNLTRALNWVNVSVLVPILAWTILQGELFYRVPKLPVWIGVANPVADIAGVTAIIGGYAFAQSATLALKTPIFLMYFVILAALPIAASTRKAAAVACMTLNGGFEDSDLIGKDPGIVDSSLRLRYPLIESKKMRISYLIIQDNLNIVHLCLNLLG